MEQVSEEIKDRPAWMRLEEQCKWYDKKSRRNQYAYKAIKYVQLVVAALIPIVAMLDQPYSKWLAASGGALIAILEGLQQLGQHQFHWITYRSTAEHLKHERALFLAAAGPYRDTDFERRLVMLAERVEERVSTEHANWFNERQGRRDERRTDEKTSQLGR